MDRSIGLERVYNLGDYKSLRVSDYSNNIPEELATNDEFMSELRHLQLVSAELTYYNYSVMVSNLNEKETNEAKQEFLAEVETNLYTKLVSHMTKIYGQEEENE
jgi:hypothetical protein